MRSRRDREALRALPRPVRVLLLTDIPPSTNYSGGIHLAQLCRHLPEGALDIFAILNPNLAPTIPADLSSIPIHYTEKPNEYAWRRGSRIAANAGAFLSESYRAATARRRVGDEAVRHVRNTRPEVVWCLLEGQTMIQVGARVRRDTDASFVTQVMDPQGWWLNEHGLDRLSRRRVSSLFDGVVRASDRCGTASWAMADVYRTRYSVETVPLLPSIDESEVPAGTSAVRDSSGVLVVALAGQIYAHDAWAALVSSLDGVGWRIDGRRVALRLFGLSEWGRELALRAVPPTSLLPKHVEFSDWRPQSETLALLAECDILYCPYWFGAEFEEEARLSFPSKLTTYLAAGRPVLFHGPAYSSPAVFLQRERAGVCCTSREPAAILDALTTIATDGELRTTVTTNGRVAWQEQLSVHAQRAEFARFLGVEEDFLASGHRA